VTLESWVVDSEAEAALTLSGPTRDENSLHPPQIVFGVDPNGVMLGCGNIKREAVFQQTQLLQPFGLFQLSLGQRRKALERRTTVCIMPEMLPNLRAAGLVTIEGNRRPRELGAYVTSEVSLIDSTPHHAIPPAID